MSLWGGLQWLKGDRPDEFLLVPSHGIMIPVAAVWKDPQRPGYRGAWRNVIWQFMPSPEATMAAIDREIAERSKRS